jgi:Lipocalin-like domain
MRLGVLTATTASVLIIGFALNTGDAVAQKKSLKEQLVGTWVYASSSVARGESSKADRPYLKGMTIYTSDGYFIFVNMRSDLPKFAANHRARATPEEAKAVVAGSIAYYGRYSVNEADKVITLKIEGSTFANMVGGEEQKRMITSLTADELKFTNQAAPSAQKVEFVWKRAK